MDSTVFDDAVATRDTVTQLVAAIRKVARVVPGASEVIAAVCELDYGKPGKPDIDWDDPAAKQALVSDLVNDALAVLAGLTGDGTPERGAAAADALGLLALVAGQDIEFAEDSDGTDGRWKIARKVAPDRVISTVAREARHTRKSKSKRRDGYRGHVAAEPGDGPRTMHRLRDDDGRRGRQHRCGERRQDGLPRPVSRRRREWRLPAPLRAPARALRQARRGQGQGLSRNQGLNSGRDPGREDTGEQGRTGGLEIYGDSAYGSGEARAAYRDAGHDTVHQARAGAPGRGRRVHPR